ncbi:MAG TPA: hypothetical protein VG692_12580 [Gemmatimonadales bacterium]|nr:hypothetical protein [Gemmatimonadales bacterium]
MRWLGILLRVVGWLLTPLVVWAASLWGAWTALRITVGFDNPRSALYTTFGVALVTGTIVLYLWMQLLRRSPKLRKSLHISREGLPVIEEGEGQASRVEGQGHSGPPNSGQETP